MDIEEALDITEDKDSDIPAIQTGLGYYDWDKQLENNLAGKRGVAKTPLDYIIRCNMAPNWVPDNEHDRLIHEVRLTGTEFEEDSRTVWRILKRICLGEDAYEWIRHLENKQCGRLAVKALQVHYEQHHIHDVHWRCL